MTQTRPLCELFQVKARFYRSVNIALDYDDADAFTDYILSPLGRTVLRRIAEGLRPDSRGRAWSIVGPYGAGKSAFALFLGKVLGYPRNDSARERLREADPHAYDELHGGLPGWSESGFVVIPIVGSHEPLASAVVRGLMAPFSCDAFDGTDAGELVRQLELLRRQVDQGEPVPATVLCEAVDRAVRIVCTAMGGPLGLLIVVDELGKLLEYAALHPAQGDIFALQALAEQASRSGDRPIGLVVVLHQAFERYAAQLSPPQQREWAKVQGRFEDIGFLESSGEVLRLLGEAIQPREPLDGFAEAIVDEVSQAQELDLSPRGLSWSDAETVLRQCAPLHPTVSLVLGRLFRSRLAQNERSLFAFLTSGEPYSFQEYLRHQVWGNNGRLPFYRLDRLYDYVAAAMGSALYSLPQGKKWAEIDDALERLPSDCQALDARLIKAIGLLGLLGDQRNLRASERVLTYALSSRLTSADGQSATAEVQAAIARLCAWGIAIHRHHKDAYSLWEGSDIDLEEQFQRGLDQVDTTASLASLLQNCGQLKPYVAKRHLYETGTLRYFSPWVVDAEGINEILQRPFGVADGAIVLVLAGNGIPLQETIETVVELSGGLPSPRRDLLLFAIPQDTYTLRQALEEVLAWEWVAQNTPELEGDSIARKELAGRQIDAESRLNRLCAISFERTSTYATWHWVHGGHLLEFRNAAELSSTLSDICDQVYYGAPVVRNELVNRRTLSSAAAAARRKLIECMIRYPTRPRLGIAGSPPELSMYRSVLELSRLHHPNGLAWEFGLSDRYEVGRADKLWGAIDAFLDSTEAGKRCVTELFQLLRQPPYGVRDGLLPIYLVAAVIHWEAEVALYENGSFVPKADIAVFERLIKAPQQFYVQRYRLGEARSYLFEKYSALLGQDKASQSQATLLNAVRPLLAFVRQLPPYTHLTRSLSPEAIAVREAVLSAREPYRLLFEDLPAAVHSDARQVNTDLEVAQAFFAALRDALLELQRAYDALLSTIEAQLLEAMRLPQDMAAARQEAWRRATILQEHVADLRLKAFVLRLGDRQLPDREWLESVAACLANKPPKQWNDADLVRYETELAEIAGRFGRVEEIAVEAQHQIDNLQGATMVRLGVTAPSGEEQRDIVSILPEEEADVRAAAEALDAALQRAGASARIRIAALAEVARRTLKASSSGDGKASQ